MHQALQEAQTDHPNDLRSRLGEIRINIDTNQHMRRIESVLSMRLPSATNLTDKFLGSHMTLVGSGPSASRSINNIPKGSIICAVNGAHDWLIARGIIPDIGLMMDPNPWVAGYQTPRKDVTYIIGTTCHPKVWKRFIDAGVAPHFAVPILHDGDHERILDAFPNADFNFITGGVTTGLRGVPTLSGLGAAMIDMHGFDSCYEPMGESLYAHFKPATHHDAREITVQSRRTGHKLICRTNGAMARQIIGFQALLASLDEFAVNADAAGFKDGAYPARDADIRLRVFGDGAIPWMAFKDGGPGYRFIHADPGFMEDKYGDFETFNSATGCPSITIGQLNSCLTPLN